VKIAATATIPSYATEFVTVIHTMHRCC